MADDSEAADTGDGEPDGLQEGDVIRIGYVARTVDGGDLVDTTDVEVAEEEGVAEQGEFEPRIIVLGAGHLFEPVEEDIVGRSIGHEGTVVVETAFGEYDEEDVRTVSADKIPEDDRYPGAQVQVDGEQGRLETIIGGRARVDFNHPLAGEDIEYEYEIIEEVEGTLEKAQGLLDMFLDLDLDIWLKTDEVEEERPVEPESDTADNGGEPTEDEPEESESSDDTDEESGPEFETVSVEKESLYIEATPQLSMNQGWMFQKSQIAQEIIDNTDIDRIVVQEILDGQPAGMGGMMGGLGGMPGGAGEEEIEEALDDMDIDAEEIVEEIEGAEE